MSPITITQLTSIPAPVNTAGFALGTHTELAVELNAAMAANWGLRHQYLVTYGVAWEPLPTSAGVHVPLTNSLLTVANVRPVSDATCAAALAPGARTELDHEESVRTLVR